MSNSAIRALRVLKTLTGHLNGLSNTQLSQSLDETPTNITRALQDLISEGLVIKLENGCFSQSVQMAQMAVAHLEAMNRAENRLQELKQRTFAGAKQYSDAEVTATFNRIFGK